MTRSLLLGLALSVPLGSACRREPVSDPGRLAALRAEHEHLHQQLDVRVAGDPVVQEAQAGRAGGLILAVRAPVVQELLREAARVYFDRMTLDLGELEAKANGRIDRDTFLGRIKVGEWSVQIFIEELKVLLRAKPPRLDVVGPNELDLQVPVLAQEARGRFALRFSWDSASVANLVCRDFDLARELEGRTLRQEHTVGGTLRLSGGPDSVRFEPVIANDVIRLKVDLTEASWGVVSQALETQDSLTRCGMFVDPQKIVERLKGLAAEGIRVKLPRVMFQGFRFPGTFEHTARIEGRDVEVGVRTQALVVTRRAMWSRASIDIAGSPERTARESWRTPTAALLDGAPAELPEGERCRHRPLPEVAGARLVEGGP
ncbi:MAG TPA: hypothetical protein VIC87_03980 [Vicinamibacteria bacterium]